MVSPHRLTPRGRAPAGQPARLLVDGGLGGLILRPVLRRWLARGRLGPLSGVLPARPGPEGGGVDAPICECALDTAVARRGRARRAPAPAAARPRRAPALGACAGRARGEPAWRGAEPLRAS